MGLEHEEAVRDFISEWECEQSWDSSQIERMLDLMAPEARHHVFAWEDPFVGRDAIRDELLRQAPGFRDTREEIMNVASVGQTVFVERRDWVTMNDKRALVFTS